MSKRQQLSINNTLHKTIKSAPLTKNKCPDSTAILIQFADISTSDGNRNEREPEIGSTSKAGTLFVGMNRTYEMGGNVTWSVIGHNCIKLTSVLGLAVR